MENLKGTPYVLAKLKGSRVSRLARMQNVYGIMLYNRKGVDDLANSIAIHKADLVHNQGITGDKVKVAVFENCPANTANLAVTSSYSAVTGTACTLSNHAQNVTAIIKNTTNVDGFSPDASTYSADQKTLGALNWAIDTINVSTLNQSFHRPEEIFDGLQAEDYYKDYKVLQYPWPMIVQAAGNWCGVGTPCYEMGNDVTDEWVNHKGYNSISVGNHNDTATTMRASSCFINPSSTHGDRELPEIAANGVEVTADGIQMSGTSMSSPAVVGSVALLQSKIPILKIWPEGVRALLFAGVKKNVPNHSGNLTNGNPAANAPNTWWEDVKQGNDAFDGAGSMNINESVKIAGNRYQGAAKSRGWDIGKMTPSSFKDQNFFSKSYKVKVPGNSIARPYPFPIKKKKVKVALAWNAEAIRLDILFWQFYASGLTMDLDIRIYDKNGAEVSRSVSWDNSYEIAEFWGTPGQTYTIKVHRWSAASNKAWSWFGIAWNAN